MQIEVPYDYINILAFVTILKYEDKRYLNINTLKEYMQVILEDVKEQLEKNSINNVSLKMSKENNIDSFIKKYSSYFELKGDVIWLKPNITFEDLEELRSSLGIKGDEIFRFVVASLNAKTFEFLKIKSKRKYIMELVKTERLLENLYLKLSENNEDLEINKKIKGLLFLRGLFLENLKTYPIYSINAFTKIAGDIEMELSRFSYDNLPIDMDLWKNSIFYDPENDYEDIDDRIFDLFQYAIFGKNSIAIKKVTHVLEHLYVAEELKKSSQVLEEAVSTINDFYSDEENEYVEEDEEQEEYDAYSLLNNIDEAIDVDLLFFATFIRKINDYIKLHGESPDLDKIKYRLLYAIDMPEYRLYQNELFDKFIRDNESIELYENDFDFLRSEMLFMSHEVFINPEDDNTIKKLLLISTYFELTNDPEIAKIIGGHFNDERYSRYSEIIFADERDIDQKLYREK